MRQRRWRVDVYYSGFASTEVIAKDKHEAIQKGRGDVQKRLGCAVVLDRDGALNQLVSGLEPWEACDTAEQLVLESKSSKVYLGKAEHLNPDSIRCSSCGREFLQYSGDRFDFCPSCGAEFIDHEEPSNDPPQDKKP